MLAINDIFHNRYELLQNIGSGGFTEVWKAMDQMSNMVVAIKIFRKQDQAGIELCREEYQKTFGLSHPNIILPFHFDVAEGRPYLVMKYIKGGTMSDKIGHASIDEIYVFIDQIGAALHYIHRLETPMIHGDIKPDNILVDENGNCFLIDFGISVKLKQKFTETMPAGEEIHSAKGITPMAYRAPENFKYKNWVVTGNSVKSDVWSVGVTLYHCLYNQLPFNGEGGLGQLVMMKSGSYSIEELLDLADTDELKPINQLIVNCLQLDPMSRTQNFVLSFEVFNHPIKSKQIETIDDSFKPKHIDEKVNKNLIWLLIIITTLAVVVGSLIKNKSTNDQIEHIKYVHNPEEMIVISDDTLKRLTAIDTFIEMASQTNDEITPEIIQTSSSSNTKSTPKNPVSAKDDFEDVDFKPTNTTTLKPPITSKENVVESAENEEDDVENLQLEAAHIPTVLSEPIAIKEEIRIDPNIEIPLRLESAPEDLFQSANKNTTIAFVVDRDVKSYGEVFLKKGTKVNAVIGKRSKNVIQFRVDKIDTNAGSKVLLHKNQFELHSSHRKGTVFIPYTKSYQDVLILK